ncbi:AAA family ATPase [Gordonia hongkongensis]|uniref:AAA family ATPase n=1 Tax=Gordonia hongkongensis TaxID=1701090 RepID=UPI003D709B9F
MTDEIRSPKRWKATDLKPAEQPRWLAKGRLPRAAISLLVGDEGIGKSLLWVWLVAAITTGRALPEFGIPARNPQNVLLVVTEDDWTTTVLPRLEVAGVNLGMVEVICAEDDGSGAPVFPRDLHLVVDAEPRPALVVVDAWLDTVTAGLSVKDPQQARRALHPWKEVATVTDAAVLLLTHTNRVDSGNARDKYGATGELRKKARLTLFAQQDDDGHLVVGVEKSNTTKALPATMFTVDPIQHFDATDDHDGSVPLLRYIGESDRTARDHIADQFEGDHGDDRQERHDAVAWLREYLEIEGPAVRSADAKREAKKAGISERTLQRARKKLCVVIGYTGQPPVSTWSLPDQGPGVIDGEVIPTVAPPDTHIGGTAGTAGTTAGHDAMPPTQNDRCATPRDTGTQVAQQAPRPSVVDSPAPPVVNTPGRAPGQWLGSGKPVELPKPTCAQWLRGHVLALMADEVETVESRDLFTAGEAAGYGLDNLRRCVMNCDLIATVGRTGHGATYRLGAGSTSTVVPCPQWLDGWLRERGDWIKAADAFAAGEQAGYERTTIKSAAKRIGVLKRGQSVLTEWRFNPDYDARESA